MKKKIIVIALLFLLMGSLLIFVICNNSLKDNTINQNIIVEEPKKLTAEDVLLKLKENNTNIGTYVVYTEENDINNLLGRPNQYTSKVTFEDIRLEQVNKDLDPEEFSEAEINEPTGGTIEVFDNKEDLQKRKDYVESITSHFAVLAEYSYSNDYVLLRLNHKLTPSQAKEYEDYFAQIFN